MSKQNSSLHGEKLKCIPAFIVLLTLLLFIPASINAQVKIGDNPNTIDDNSLLELESTDKGILIPRMALDDASTAAPLTAPIVVGTQIYNSGGSEEDGFYYWDGSQWRMLLTSANTNQDRDNYVLVKSASDLPAPVGGIITLTAGTFYEINGTIALTSQIDLNGCYVSGLDVNNDILVYGLSSGSMFTGNNGGTIKNVTMVAANAGSKIFDVDDITATKNLIIRDCIIANTNNIGDIKGFDIVFCSVINFSGNTNGITFEDITHLLLENMAWFPNNSNTFETYVGDFEIIERLGGFSEAMLANSATALDVTGVTSIDNGEIKDCSFSGDGTRITGTFTKEWEVESTGVNTETDDVASGNIYISASATTSIAAVNTPIKASGTTASANLFRFTSPVSNRMVYDGTKTRNFEVIVSLSMTAASNNKVFSFYVAKNGTVVTESEQQRKVAAGADVGALTITTVVNLAPGDYIEVWVENNTDATDLTIEFMNLSVK